MRRSLSPLLTLFALAAACSGESQTPGTDLDATGGSATGGMGSMGPGGGTSSGASGGTSGSGGSSTGGTGSDTGGSAPGGVSSGGSSDSGGSSVGGSSGSGGDSSGGGNSTGGGSAGGSSAGGSGGEAFLLTSPALENVAGCSLEQPAVCDAFPDENIAYLENANVSPELSWTGVPAGTQSFALVLFDVTFGQAHWALWNIPATTTTLAADVPKDTATPATPAGSQQANANFATTGGDGYFGPHVPCNVYEFQLYALSTSTFSPMDPESSVLVSIELAELDQSVLGLAKLTGRGADDTTSCE